MAKETSSILDEMRNRIKNGGGNFKNIFRLKDKNRNRVRFLKDMEDAIKVPFHDKWGDGGYSVPCKEIIGKECPRHDDNTGNVRDNFAWPVYNYDNKKQELFMFKANRSSPIPNLIAMYEAYNTIMDRDFIISRAGTGTDTTYAIVPMDPKKFKFGDKIKTWSKKDMLALIFKTFKDEEYDDEDSDEEDEAPKKKTSSKSEKKSSKKKVEEDEDDDDEDDDSLPWDDEEDDEEDSEDDDDDDSDDEDEEEDDDFYEDDDF